MVLNNEKRGRPIDLSRNKIILQATLDLLAEGSFDSLTMEAVAERAKVGKGAIYRRWPSKTELIIETAFYMSRIGTNSHEIDKKQSLRNQLVTMLNLYFLKDESKYQRAMTSICLEASNNTEVQKRLNSVFYQVYKETFTSIISSAEFEKKIDSKLDFNILADIAPALMMYRNILGGNPVDNDYIETVVDTLLMPLIESTLIQKNKC